MSENEKEPVVDAALSKDDLPDLGGILDTSRDGEDGSGRLAAL